jgi:molybdenum cofactor guanylyltransferase
MAKGASIKSILGVVLAGGKSSRMGTDKARLPYGKKTLLDFQFEKLESVLGRENILVSGNYPHLPHLVDLEVGLGPLGGITSVINSFSDFSYFLFLPVDMPNISKKALINLIDFAQNDFISNCWSFKDFQMPLIIKNHSKIQDLLRMPARDRSIRNLAEHLKSRTLELGQLNKKEFLNTNTLIEWQEVIL